MNYVNFSVICDLRLGKIEKLYSYVYFLLFCRDYVNDALYDATNREAVGVATLVVVLAVSPIIIWLVHNAVATIQVNPRFFYYN